LIAILAFVIGVVASARFHLLTLERVHCHIGVNRNRFQLDITCRPLSLLEFAADCSESVERCQNKTRCGLPKFDRM
jgi:hypothetical protein